jgi:hypothetical protein
MNKVFTSISQGLKSVWHNPYFFKTVGGTLSATFLILLGLGWYWSLEPDTFSPKDVARQQAELRNETFVVGYTTIETINQVMDTLLHKPGGYLSNDIMPTSWWLDDMPAWEFGVLVQTRDIARIMRRDFSRSQSQSSEDINLKEAEPRFNMTNDSWAFPASESEYTEGLKYVGQYRVQLSNANNQSAQFFARADNLVRYLSEVETRLGSLSQKLSASVGQQIVNIDLAGDASAEQATPSASGSFNKTPWLKIDDVFYEARGTAWALLHYLKAIETDFDSVLRNKNALTSLKQIIRDLEKTQDTVYSPMILNGSGFGIFANHSLVMANYISRANAALIDLRELLENG